MTITASIIALRTDPYRITGGTVLCESLTPAQAELLDLTPDEDWMLYTLSPVAGTEITLQQRETTDEGWSARTERVWYDSEERAFYREWCDDGRDCDGRLTTGGTLRSTGDRRPNGRTVWQEVRETRRDYQAEAAGY